MSVRIGHNYKITDTVQKSFSLKILYTLIEYCIVVNKIGGYFSLIFAFIRGIK